MFGCNLTEVEKCQAVLPLFEIALVLVRFDHLAY
jgi:hypothetical protein